MEDKKKDVISDAKLEQEKKWNIAQYYTNGDKERSREMVEGTYQDMFAIKSIFHSSSMNGAFLIFYNSIYHKLGDLLIVVVPSYMSKEPNTGADWKIFEGELQKLIENNENDIQMSLLLRNKFTDAFSFTFAAEVSRMLTAKNNIALERAFQKLIKYIWNIQRMDLKVDFQPLSSLDMELNSKSSLKLSKNIVENLKEEKPKDGLEIQPIEESDTSQIGEPQVGKEGVKLLLKGTLILSPFSGKDISKLDPGDRVKVSIVDKNPQAVTVAKALGAYKDDKFFPVIGRIKSVKYKESAGYIIFTIIAKGIFVRIDEEETSIKVAMDDAFEVSQTIKDEKLEFKISAPVLVLLIVVFLIIIGLILIKIL